MKTACIILVIALFVGTDALSCFECRSPRPEDCRHPDSKLRKQTYCGEESPLYTQYCASKYYYDYRLQSYMTVFGCGKTPNPFNKKSVDYCIPPTHHKMTDCYICLRDYCNDS